MEITAIKTLKQLIDAGITLEQLYQFFECLGELKLQTKSDMETDNIGKDRIPKIEIVIAKLLKELGMPSHLLGYKYTTIALKKRLMEGENSLKGITKNLYPSIAQECNTNSSRVERAIRFAIQVAMNRGNIEKIQSIFSYSMKVNQSKPTNTEFLSGVAEYIELTYEI